MKNIKKITALSLFLAITLFAGGTCVLPMASARAAEMGMDDMSAMSADGYSAQNTHCLENSDDGCVTTGNEGGFLSCFLSCGSSVSKTVTVKKIQDTVPGAVQGAPLGSVLGETGEIDFVPDVWMKSGSEEEKHLSVAKKE